MRRQKVEVADFGQGGEDRITGGAKADKAWVAVCYMLRSTPSAPPATPALPLPSSSRTLPPAPSMPVRAAPKTTVSSTKARSGGQRTDLSLGHFPTFDISLASSRPDCAGRGFPGRQEAGPSLLTRQQSDPIRRQSVALRPFGPDSLCQPGRFVRHMVRGAAPKAKQAQLWRAFSLSRGRADPGEDQELWRGITSAEPPQANGETSA